MTNEFKNMAAGGPEVMLAIPNLSNSPSFDWTGCEFPNCASMIHHLKECEKAAAVFLGAAQVCKGRIARLFTGGAGASDSSDCTYVTSINFLRERMVSRPTSSPFRGECYWNHTSEDFIVASLTYYSMCQGTKISLGPVGMASWSYCRRGRCQREKNCCQKEKSTEL